MMWLIPILLLLLMLLAAHQLDRHHIEVDVTAERVDDEWHEVETGYADTD